MKPTLDIYNDNKLIILQARIMELFRSIDLQEKEIREQEVLISELMKQTTRLTIQKHELEMLRNKKEAYIIILENSCSLRIGRMIGKPFIRLKAFAGNILSCRAVNKMRMLIGLMVTGLEQPVQLLKNINLRNMRTLKAALNREHPALIKKNLKKLLLRDQNSASTWNIPLYDADQKCADDIASAAQRQQATLRYTPLLTIIIPVYNTPLIYLDKCINSVINQTYQNWELCIVDDGSTDEHIKPLLKKYSGSDHRIKLKYLENNSGIAGATNEGLKMATGEFVAFVDHDDELVEHALLEVVKQLNDHPEADVIYTDQDYIEANGEVAQHFYKPDWSPELFRGVMYVGHLLLVRRTLALQVNGFDSQFNNIQDFEFMLRVSEKTTLIYHIPKILYHWRKIPGSVAYGGNEKSNIEPLQASAVNEHLKRSSISATAYSNPHFAHRVILKPHTRKTWPAVRIMMHLDACNTAIERCLDSILRLTNYPNYEVILFHRRIINNPLKDISRKFPIKIVEYKKASTYTYVNAINDAVANGGSEYIVLLNGTLEVITKDWIEMLLFYAGMPHAGCVGPLILNNDDTVFDAGLVLGFDGAIGSIMRGMPAHSDGYAGSLSCTREVSAVGEYCMMLSQDLFIKYGGLQEYYISSYYATDLALRLFSDGRKNIVTPQAILSFHEYKQQEIVDPIDTALFKDRWRHLIKQGDLFYNPNFSLIKHDYSLSA